MKKIEIIVLVLIAAAIAVLVSFMGNLTTYETVASAKEKEGKAVKLVVSLVPNTIEYDAVKNPNYLTFMAKDTLNNTIKVIYHDAKPTDMEKSTRIVLNGKIQNNQFECKSILLKCPSKYKNEEAASKQVATGA
ncbi:MAG: cytochrome c maturation protein CcmE [Bacteroidetes bacterium]|jgi:cytochrome c-type biogenesis protein CcmE|nr:cytochrome c maturation protein CcmE [Bacteroidota bacterium]